MINFRFLILMIIGCTISSISYAAQSPTPGQKDARVTTVKYRKSDVVKVYSTYGISTMIIFADDEKFETIALGDTQSWEIVPATKGNILFVKPVAENVRTNMNVVTSKRIYYFELIDVKPERRRKIFGIRFRYPEKIQDAELMEEAERRAANPAISQITKDNVNIDYSFTGSKKLRPQEIFDDGKQTFFRFQKNRVPAIYTVSDNYSERLVNFRREGKYIVVDGEHTQFTLRNGNSFVCIFNLGKPDFDAPNPFVNGPKKTNVKLRPYRKSGNSIHRKGN